MKIEGMGRHTVKTREELEYALQDTLDELNRTRESHCWVCDKIVRTWAVLFPAGAPDALGFGSSEMDGQPMTRIAFIAICPEHDIDDEVNLKKIKERLKSLTSQLSN